MRMNVHFRSVRDIVPLRKKGVEEVLMWERLVVKGHRRWMKRTGEVGQQKNRTRASVIQDGALTRLRTRDRGRPTAGFVTVEFRDFCRLAHGRGTSAALGCTERSHDASSTRSLMVSRQPIKQVNAEACAWLPARTAIFGCDNSYCMCRPLTPRNCAVRSAGNSSNRRLSTHVLSCRLGAPEVRGTS
jgi:hypothetical protein